MSENPSPRIKVDWTVPIWGVLGLVVQAVGIVWFAASLTAQTAQNTQQIAKLETRVAAVESTASVIGKLDERTRLIYDVLMGRSGAAGVP